MTSEDLLERFTNEVLVNGVQACLPCNLTDEWLGILAAQADTAIHRPDEGRLTELVAVIFHVVAYQRGLVNGSIEITEEELYRRFGEYLVELTLEDFSRDTQITIKPATLDTLFTNRSLETRLDET